MAGDDSSDFEGHWIWSFPPIFKPLAKSRPLSCLVRDTEIDSSLQNCEKMNFLFKPVNPVIFGYESSSRLIYSSLTKTVRAGRYSYYSRVYRWGN